MSSVGPKPTVPKGPSEVTKEWLSSVMCSIDGVISTEVVSLDPEKTQSGLLSSVFRAEVVVTRPDDTRESLKLFMKVMPLSEVHQTIVGTMFVVVSEIESYRRLFEDLRQFEREHCKKCDSDEISSVVPLMYAGEYLKGQERAYFIILEDLSPDYQMMDFNKGLTMEQLASSLRLLARFQALCYCMGKVRKINFKKKYDFLSDFFLKFDTDAQLQGFMDMNMGLVEKDLEESPNKDLLIHVKNIRYARIFKKS